MAEISKEANELLLLLKETPCYPLSKAMIRLIGKDDAILLTDLIEMHFYTKINGSLEKDGWFTKTIEDRKTSTGIKYHSQNKIIGRLKKRNFIETKNLGYPSRIGFRINFNEIKKLLLSSDDLLTEMITPSTDLGDFIKEAQEGDK